MAKTSKYISSISYNSKKFLLDKLDALIYTREISYYEFIQHYPDEDDKKKHFHLFIMPNHSLDLALFKDYFNEYTFNFKKIKCIKKILLPTYFLFGRQSYKNKPKFKPLGCMPFRVTHKYGDWYWYVIHNTDYLRAKELVRNLHYSDSDIYSYNLDFHNTLVLENKLEDFCTMGDVQLIKYCLNCIKNNISFAKMLKTGYIPLNKVNQFKTFYNSVYTNSNTYSSSSDVLIDYADVDINRDSLPYNQIYAELPFKDDLFD